MDFDACDHRMRQVIIRAGIQRRKDLGLKEENNITVLYNEMAPLLGVQIVQLDSTIVDHLPSPSENINWPKIPCPKCGKNSFLGSICQSCSDAKDENGNVVYRSGYLCDEKSGGCGFVSEKTGEWITQRLLKMGWQVPTGTKESLGIKTKTDEGIQ